MSSRRRSVALALSLLAQGGVTLASGAGTPPPVPSEGTRRMAARLLAIDRDLSAEQNLFDAPKVVASLRAQLLSSDHSWAEFGLHYQLALYLLFAGQTDEAITEIHGLLALPDAIRALAGPELDYQLHDLFALAYLRRGEQENCLARHGAESCLFPIHGSGIHTVKRGSEAAIAEYRRQLHTRPGDLAARWLLNLACMTVGEYPDGVPTEWLIPPLVFASEYDIKRFPNVATEAGVAPSGLAGGSILDDLDGDGYLDLLVSSWGTRDPLHFFHNNADGSFADRTAGAGLVGETGGLNLTHADYDNDGNPDVFIPRGAWRKSGGRFPNSLLRGDGNGTFSDVTEEAGLLTFHPTQVAAWGDFDNDGLLDLFVGNESAPADPHPSELWHNQGDGTFADWSARLPCADLGYVKGATWGDYDNDGRLDLYVSVLEGDNVLLHNDGESAAGWSFTDVTAEAGTGKPFRSFATWFWDYDNDGWLDLFAASYLNASVADVAAIYLGLPQTTEMPRLYRNRHDGTFEDVTRSVRLDRVALVMGANFGDLDNDGWPDLYLGTGDPDLRTVVPNRMFRNAGGKVFQDVTTSGGFGHLQKGHGVSFGDIDNDGDQDIYAVIGGAMTGDIAQNVLFENPGHGNHWVTLRLEGRQSNRSAIGTRIRVRVRVRVREQDGGATRDIHVTVGSGGSFGDSSLQQEIGLGQAEAIESVVLDWPAGGSTQVFRNVAMDRIYRVVEGDPELTVLTSRKFQLGGRAAPTPASAPAPPVD